LNSRYQRDFSFLRTTLTPNQHACKKNENSPYIKNILFFIASETASKKHRTHFNEKTIKNLKIKQLNKNQ